MGAGVVVRAAITPHSRRGSVDGGYSRLPRAQRARRADGRGSAVDDLPHRDCETDVHGPCRRRTDLPVGRFPQPHHSRPLGWGFDPRRTTGSCSLRAGSCPRSRPRAGLWPGIPTRSDGTSLDSTDPLAGRVPIPTRCLGDPDSTLAPPAGVRVASGRRTQHSASQLGRGPTRRPRTAEGRGRPPDSRTHGHNTVPISSSERGRVRSLDRRP